jgi:hypothetical protein
MPTTEAHLRKADHNKRFVSQITDEFRDWRVTAWFYVGVHYVESWLAPENKHSNNHGDRTRYLSETRNAPTARKMHLYDHYRDLYDLAISARYECDETSVEDARDAEDAAYKIEQFALWKAGKGPNPVY